MCEPTWADRLTNVATSGALCAVPLEDNGLAGDKPREKANAANQLVVLR